MNSKQYKLLFEKVSALVRKKFSSAPGCHDWDHTFRVLRNSQEICRGEPTADRKVVEISALLHDIARKDDLKKKDRQCHAEKGALLAKEILGKFNFVDTDFIERVSTCIRNHRYRGNNPPVSLEEKIVYDADKLDSLGAVGIGRAFHFAGRIKARLHNTAKEALSAESYTREDTAYREYLVKMRHLPEKMFTKTGKKIARNRIKYMKDFFRRLEYEIKGKA